MRDTSLTRNSRKLRGRREATKKSKQLIWIDPHGNLLTSSIDLAASSARIQSELDNIIVVAELID